MASMKLLPPATILQLLVVTSVLGATSHLVASAAAGFDAEATCREVAEYPKLCGSLAKAYRPTSSSELVEAAINESISRAKRAKWAFDVLRLNNSDESVAEPLRRCSVGFAKVADELGESLRRIRGEGRGRAERGFFYSRNVLEFCYDSFDPGHEYNGRMDFPGKRSYTGVKKTVLNAYSLACGSKAVDCIHF